MRRLGMLLCALAVGACGESGVPSGDSLGTGSGTLRVDGRVEARAEFRNASDPNDFTTSFEIDVSKAGVDVTNATVMVGSDGGAVELVHRADEPGTYTGSQVGYYERYELFVEAGDDYVSDVRVDGPDIHVFTSPQQGETVQGGLDLTIEWDRDEQAESATLETQEMDEVSIQDTGSFLVPASGLRHDGGEVRDERVRLWRMSRVSPAGGTGGSEFSVEIRNEIDILVAP